MKKEIKNLPASVHDRLKRLAKEEGRPFQELFYFYAIERFLFRLSESSYSDRFVLKGALMFAGWGIFPRRPTRDIDLQGLLRNSVDYLVSVVKEICEVAVVPDGMMFDPSSVRGEQIMDEANYQGIRVYFTGYLGNAPIYLHLDVSFANVITPQEILVNYPSLLGMPDFQIYGYPYETAIAEKFQAMVVLDRINDRMKDFYDIWLLSERVQIRGETLLSAMHATFRERNTALPVDLPTALTSEFARQRQPDWTRFLKRSILQEQDMPSFELVIGVLREFLWPVVQNANENSLFDKIWLAGGPWQAL